MQVLLEKVHDGRNILIQAVCDAPDEVCLNPIVEIMWIRIIPAGQGPTIPPQDYQIVGSNLRSGSVSPFAVTLQAI